MTSSNEPHLVQLTFEAQFNSSSQQYSLHAHPQCHRSGSTLVMLTDARDPAIGAVLRQWSRTSDTHDARDSGTGAVLRQWHASSALT